MINYRMELLPRFSLICESLPAGTNHCTPSVNGAQSMPSTCTCLLELFIFSQLERSLVIQIVRHRAQWLGSCQELCEWTAPTAQRGRVGGGKQGLNSCFTPTLGTNAIFFFAMGTGVNNSIQFGLFAFTRHRV